MLKNFYAIFRFLFEILAVVITGYWGFGLNKLGTLRFVAGILAPMCIVIVWSIWGAPASTQKLSGIPHLLLELGIYALSALCLFYTNQNKYTFPFALLGAANAAIHFFSKGIV